ncbi:MAG: YtxH domain-containing protein [Bacteroidales bacterium]|jgi:gas vesicle protein|nr:YtxH domain-containing protein [Bacteroidales bacterium]
MAKSGLKVLAAGLVGIAAGIGIGILIAPSKGSRTRKRLKKQFLDLADMVEDNISGTVNSVKSAFSADIEKPVEPVEDETGAKPEEEEK